MPLESADPQLSNGVKNAIEFICFMAEILQGAQSSGAQNSANNNQRRF
jgi:hypothetical protein